MKNTKMIGLSISGTIILLASFIIFMLLKPSDGCASVMLGFCFLIFSEILLYGGLVGLEFVRSQSVISRIGFGISIIGYSVMSMIISVIFIFMNTDETKYFIAIEVIGFAISAVLSVIFLLMIKRVRED